MIEDLTKTIKAQLYERVSSPLFSSFILAWAACNYRFLIVIFSSMDTLEKFLYIDFFIYPSLSHIFLRGVVCPLITTVLIIFAYPIPAKFVYQYWRKRQRELKEIQQRIDDETPLTKEEARAIRSQAFEESEEYERQLDRQKSEIVDLKMQIEKLRNHLEEYSQESRSEPVEPDDDYEPQMTHDQREILKEIALSSGSFGVDYFTKGKGIDRLRREHDLQDLVNRRFVKHSPIDSTLSITHEGRAYILEQEEKV